MRILMMGWEFPPYISGGLGTACHGLTQALAQRGDLITFVLPKDVGSDYQSHIRLLTPQSPKAAPEAGGDRSPQAVASTFQAGEAYAAGLPGVTFKAVPSRIASPYPGGSPGLFKSRAGGTSGGVSFLGQHATTLSPAPGQLPNGASSAGTEAGTVAGANDTPNTSGPNSGDTTSGGGGGHYDGDLVAQTRRYADLCLDLAAGEDFDVIHAHDWLTFPAAAAVAQATGKPWVAHIHSTEYDRSGDSANAQIVQIERDAVHSANAVIAVSYLTSSILADRYGLDPAKCQVIYNGVERIVRNGAEHEVAVEPTAGITKDDKVVLFLGRVTMQKGPAYFIAAAKKVLEKMDNVKFVVAGSGDQIDETIELAARAGIGDKVTFTGFLRGEDVGRVYAMADVFVMPSVSEPFGIAPLEAIAHEVPVIISKTSGVAEVLSHALKVDFWDTLDIANKIIAVLRHPPLGQTMRKHADLEVRELTWAGAAQKCQQVYTALGVEG